jgi:glycosyltransferase involved in cell wall biosynthesis
MYSWSHLVDGFMAASPSLAHFAQRFGRVEPWKVSLVPNAAPDAVFDLPLRSFDDKTKDGVARVVTAARLAKDKLPQLSAAIDTITTAANLRPDLKWVLDVYGDGPLRDTFESRYRQAFGGNSNIEVVMHGWIEPNEVPQRLNEAVIGVMAGMGGVRSVASGALTVGVGARGVVGVQRGANLRAGIWSNFGDHGVMRFEASPIASDLEDIFRSEAYDETVAVSRRTLRRTNSQSIVDGMMLSALQC